MVSEAKANTLIWLSFFEAFFLPSISNFIQIFFMIEVLHLLEQSLSCILSIVLSVTLSSWYQCRKLNFVEIIHGLGEGFLGWFCFGFCLRIITPAKKGLWLVGILWVAPATNKLHSLKDLTVHGQCIWKASCTGIHHDQFLLLACVFGGDVAGCWCCYSKRIQCCGYGHW